MKPHTYACTFSNGLKATMEIPNIVVEPGRAGMLQPTVTWTPAFDRQKLEAIKPEFEQWLTSCLAHAFGADDLKLMNPDDQ